MAKQVYADNVDANGVAYPTTGENIRDGAKSAESVVKALQSDEITFDMQAIMNVLPFMDSSKKIEEVTLTVSNNGNLTGNDIVRNPNSWWYNKKVYTILFGEMTRGSATAGQTRIQLYCSSDNGVGVWTIENQTANNGFSVKLYLCVDK